MELSEKESKERYCEAKSKLLDYEETMINLRANVKQLENQAQEYKEVGKLKKKLIMNNKRRLHINRPS